MIFFLCASASAQEWEGVAGDVSAGMKWRISPMVTFSSKFQLRTEPNFKGVDRQSIDAFVSLKLTKWLRLSSGYSLLLYYSDEGFVNPRNRFTFDLTASLKSGNWNFSLKEKFQFTNKDYAFNPYELVPNECSLTTIFKVAYAGLKKVEPYASVEAKFNLNDPFWTYDYDEASCEYMNSQFTGYKTAHISRIRPTLGLDWSVTENHAIDFRLFCDFFHKQKIKASTDGTELTSISWKNTVKLTTCIAYTYSF